MPLPALNENGLLPEGIHDCTLEEIGAQFGCFVVSERRVRLFARLRELIEEERRGPFGYSRDRGWQLCD